MQFSWVINKFALNKCPFLGFIVNYNVQVLLISLHYQLIRQMTELKIAEKRTSQKQRLIATLCKKLCK